MTLEDSLRRFRKDFNLTQKQVAEAIGIAETAYQKYEHGKVKPSVDVIERIADFYKVSTDYLLGRIHTPHLGAFEESPKITSPDFLDRIIFETRLEHSERLAQVKGKVENPAVEYADLLLRYYHRALLSKLIESGTKL